ncbi:peroxiredoxin family protein [Alkaliphilus peptidifermentans]|uniref:Peroxiredoxin n=1 Tax=Alkaliphilus peptidifermentans DSM 18978 TaxID=1120976 RepID=A0A1G5APE6_9FIRM|nr:TlpA disulfide reductase family protein [Alkaliphilus peptidifermentans]SCX79737.1 Peroxiredoxin [Alkaliphilus peptidifermentans DSM 18978]
MKLKKIVIVAVLLITLFIVGGCRKTVEEPIDEQAGKANDYLLQEAIEGDLEEIDDETEENESRLGVHIGNKAPSFKMQDYLGSEVELEDYKGKPVIFTFWVSWSDMAIDQLKVLENVSLLLGEDAAFIGVHVAPFDTLTEDEAVELIKNNKYNINIVIDNEGKVQQEYYVGIYPTTYIIDPEGRIVKSYTTLVEEDQILEDLEYILSQFLP